MPHSRLFETDEVAAAELSIAERARMRLAQSMALSHMINSWHSYGIQASAPAPPSARETSARHSQRQALDRQLGHTGSCKLPALSPVEEVRPRAEGGFTRCVCRHSAGAHRYSPSGACGLCCCAAFQKAVDEPQVVAAGATKTERARVVAAAALHDFLCRLRRPAVPMRSV